MTELNSMDAWGRRQSPYLLLLARTFLQTLRLVCLCCACNAIPLLAHMDISEGIALVSVQIEANPNSAELYLQRGELYRAEAHWSAALADFDRAHTLDQRNVLAQLGLGNTWLDQGDHARAMEHLDAALALQPDSVRVRVARAKAWRLAGEPLAAAREYEQIINSFVIPDDPLPEYYFEHARALEAAGAGYVDAALATLDAGNLRLGNIRVLQDYAIALERQRGNHVQALRRLDQLIEQSARKESLLLTRGDILREAGLTQQAETAYAAALAAIDALPTRHRNSPSMIQLREELEHRTLPPAITGTGE